MELEHTTGQGGLSQPMVRLVLGTPSKSVSGLHCLPLPMDPRGHCVYVR